MTPSFLPTRVEAIDIIVGWLMSSAAANAWGDDEEEASIALECITALRVLGVSSAEIQRAVNTEGTVPS